MTIPSFFDTEEYLQIPIMRKFLSDHDLKLDGNKSDLISKIEHMLLKILKIRKK